MHVETFKILRLMLVLSWALVLMLVPTAGSAVVKAQTGPQSGMICATNPSATFALTAQPGYINTPDGNVVYMWGFSEGGQPFQHPGPVLCVNQGQTVTIVLNNTLTRDVSIVFPGQEDVLANGVPAEPQFDGGGNLISLAPVATAGGGSVTYRFVATNPGTYIYESGTEPAVQVNMGLFGALVVRPTLGADYAYNHADTQFKPTTEYLMLLSEIDPLLHQAVEQNVPYNMNNYRARYWMINGRGFPDTVAPNNATYLPGQPYSSLAHIHPYDPVENPYPALIRYINVGTEEYPFHPHGNHGRIIARDGQLLRGPLGQDMSFEQFTVNIGPGQTWDALFAWADVEQWHPVNNPVPVTIPQLQNLAFGQFYSGSPYLGYLDLLPVGHQGLNQCGEYWHIAHNHALQQITAWGVVTSSHITFTRIDPPLSQGACP